MDEASAAENPYIASMGMCFFKRDALQYVESGISGWGWDLRYEWKIMEILREVPYAMEWCVFMDLFEGSWGKSIPEIHSYMDQYFEVWGLPPCMMASLLSLPSFWCCGVFFGRWIEVVEGFLLVFWSASLVIIVVVNESLHRAKYM